MKVFLINYKRLGILAIGFFMSTFAMALDLKFEDLEKPTLEGNTSIHASGLRLRAMEARTGYLWKSFLPVLGVQAGYETFQTGTYPTYSEPYGQTGVRINIFNGFRDTYQSQVRNAGVIIARAEQAVLTQRKLSEARLLYSKLAYNKELQQLYQAILKDNEEAQKSARFRLNQGMVTRTDVLEFEIYGGQLREEIESAKHEMQIVSIQLSAALGMEQRTDINPIDLLNHMHDDALVHADFRKIPTAGSLLIQGEEAYRVAESSRAGSWWLPSVDVYSEYALFTLRERDYLLRRDRDDWATGIHLSWTFFDTNAMTDSSASSYERKAMHEDAKQKFRDYSAKVKSIQEEMIHLHDLIHSAEDRVKLGETYLNSTRGDYKRGVKNSPDVIAAIEKQIGFQKTLLDRKLGYREARDRLVALTQSIEK